jgi:hypothetical protein
MFNKERLKLGFRIIIAAGLLFYLTYITPIALSKYTKEATSTSKVGIALYVLDANYYTESISLLNLTPRAEPYIYTFKVANFNASKHAETSLTYDLSLKMTTNMPLTYALYMNHDTNNSIVTGDTTVADTDGTYFRTFTTATQTMAYNQDVENIYTLYVYFPAQYNDVKYQDLAEYVEINVDSKQIIE